MWGFGWCRFILMSSKPKRGGLREPKGGRPPKPPQEKYRRRLITLPPEIDDKLQRCKIDKSKLIADLLKGYFEALESI